MNSKSSSLNLSDILARLQSLKAVLPTDIVQDLGSFEWSQRLHAVHLRDESTDKKELVVRFFSDGIALKTKSLIENIIKESVGERLDSLTIYFERKEKPAASATPPTQKGQGAAGEGAASPHSHSHAPGAAEKRAPSAQQPIAGVKHILAVASGKGGVGKSTVSVNLALALHHQGYKVGILDADIYGPSVPTMLNIHQDPIVNEQNKIVPPESYGLKVMSFGFFAPEETAVIWRGPMIMKALQQFFWDVDWGELDFLVIDLPPGTGDAQLTLVQSIPISGAVIVTTPQNIALLDAVKGIAMFQKTNVPILGVVENMSSFTCPACGSESSIFGAGGAKRVSDKFEVPLLGHVPLIPEIRVAGDVGEPLTAIAGHGVRVRFSEIAERVVAECLRAR